MPEGNCSLSARVSKRRIEQHTTVPEDSDSEVSSSRPKKKPRRTRDRDSSPSRCSSKSTSSKRQDLASTHAETKPDLSAYHMKEILNGEVYYFPTFISESDASSWHKRLLELDTWYHPKLKVYGKEVAQSRSIAAYASDVNLKVKYSGHNVELHHEYPALLEKIQSRVEAFLGEKFNHVMLNLYESGQEYIGKHRDTKENKVITSLSLGAERTFIMTPNKNNTGASTHKWTLSSGSLLVMRGKTQDNWKHEIPRETKIKESRISLTFRQLSSS